LAESALPSGQNHEVAPSPKPEVRDGYLAIGVALTSFGLQGDIKVEPLTDFPERFEPGEVIWLGGRKRHVQRSRWQGRTVYLKLTGINSSEDVGEVRGQYLEVPEADRADLPPDEYFQSDIIGLSVETTAGAPLGQVLEFLPTGANDVLVVRGPDGDVLVPMIEDVVKTIDVPGGRIVIEPLAGLLPEPTTPKPRRAPTRGPAWRRRLAARAGAVPPSAEKPADKPADKPAEKPE
jgi:16S rRNA processing protein RimM